MKKDLEWRTNEKDILLRVNVRVLQKQAGPTVTVVSEGRSSEWIIEKNYFQEWKKEYRWNSLLQREVKRVEEDLDKSEWNEDTG